MGGGAAMRAAAKAAGFGVANAALRGVPPVASSGEHPIAAAARKATRPVPAIVSSSDDVVLTASQNNKIDATAQRPYWELEDWELAGGEEDLVLGSNEPLPRLVFGGPPTPLEAKEATSELNEVLEKVYLSSPNSDGCLDSLMTVYNSGLSLPSKPENLENKACVTSETRATSVPKTALQAFRLLSESPAAQSVVAAIASDPNVWHAVLENPDLKEYLYSQKSSAPSSCIDPLVEESVGEVKVPDDESPKSFDDASNSGKSGHFGDKFTEFVKNIKTSVAHMVRSLSGHFQNIFGGPAAEKASADVDGSAKTSFMESPLGAFMGLAVLVIMVVVLKRG